MFASVLKCWWLNSGKLGKHALGVSLHLCLCLKYQDQSGVLNFSTSPGFKYLVVVPSATVVLKSVKVCGFDYLLDIVLKTSGQFYCNHKFEISNYTQN
jgi:hypothetical protein